MSNIEKQSELFRLATVLYADNNYEVSLKTIHRKIVESVLLEVTKEISIHGILDFIDKEYKITVSEETLKNVILKEPDKFDTINRNGELHIRLTEKRKLQLQDKIKDKTLEFFIAEFEEEHPHFKDTKELINRFVYDVFSTNTEAFQKLLNNKKEITDLLNISQTNYTDKEKEVINNFLFWDNQDKNKAIFNISSYALEYCMLTNKNGSTSIDLKDIKNKYFYLDTNIVYRGLGINGENRKNRTRTFLRKFLEADEKLVITKITDREFKDSIKSHLKRIEAYNSPRAKSKLFQLVEVQKDIFEFYHLWRCGKTNTNIDLFEAEIIRLYSEFKKEFQIEFEANIPYDKKNNNILDKIKDYTSEISQSKTDSIDKAEFDAENILWVETKRNGNAENIFDARYFFISTDQGLHRWDYHRKNLTPIVLLPSQWMTIILRYFNCTADDYKSFISFLNLKNNEKLIEGEKLHCVLAGIGEMTENVEHQGSILNILIANKFDAVIKKDSTQEQIYQNSKIFAKNELEKLLEKKKIEIEALENKNKKIETQAQTLNIQHTEIQKELEKLTKNAENTTEKLKSEIETAQTVVYSVKEHSEKIKNENLLLKKKLQEQFIEGKLNKWKHKIFYIHLPLIVLILLFFFFQIFFKEWEYNLPAQLIKWIDQNPSESIRNLFMGLNLMPIPGVITLIVICYKRYFCDETKTKQIEKIRQKMPNEYRMNGL